jgi:rubrerythrin
VYAQHGPAVPGRSPAEQLAMDQLLGLAVFGEKVAARTYALMAEIKPEYGPLLRQFATMEGRHGSGFADCARKHGFTLDREFADRELGYLITQVDTHRQANDFDALAVLQGFIVESLAISTYEPFVQAARRYPGMEKVFATALAEERYHVDWVTRYLRLRFFDASEELLDMVERVNVQGIDCVGGTLMNITRALEEVGMSGADCAGGMADEYTQLLEAAGVPERAATRNVVSLFHPVIRKFRRGERTK